MPLKLKLTPGEAISRLESNDNTLVTCDLSNNAVLQIKTAELVPKLAQALSTNSVCKELNLSNCNIDDVCVGHIAKALATNSTLVHLNLEGNKVNNEGATHLANALSSNRGLMQLNLLSQKGSSKHFGDSTLTAFLTMFDSNLR